MENLIRQWAEMLNESIDESEDFDFARKLGYGGRESDVAEWLKGDYAKWKKYVYETFLRLANGDEDQAAKWLETYDRLASSMIGTRFGTENGYVDSEDVKKDLAKELGDDPDAKELIKKIDDKWKADAKSLTEFYATHQFTGD